MTTPDHKPLPPRQRIALAAIAFGGTSLYGMSFARLTTGDEWRVLAVGVSIGSGVAWCVLGAVIVAFERARIDRLWCWFDACLVTMAHGMIVLLFAAVMNLFVMLSGAGVNGQKMLLLHAALLLFADIRMCVELVRRTRRFGASPAAAMVLWILVLNGSFVVILWLITRLVG